MGINLTNYVQDLYEDNSRTKEPNKQRDITHLWIGAINIIEMSVFLNLTSRVKAIQLKPQQDIVDMDDLILKFMWDKDPESPVVQ